LTIPRHLWQTFIPRVFNKFSPGYSIDYYQCQGLSQYKPGGSLCYINRNGFDAILNVIGSGLSYDEGSTLFSYLDLNMDGKLTFPELTKDSKGNGNWDILTIIDNYRFIKRLNGVVKTQHGLPLGINAKSGIQVGIS